MKDLRMSPTIKFLPWMLLLALVLTGCGGGPIQASSWPGVTVADDTLYIAYNQYVLAYDLETEREIWRYPAEVDRTQTFYAPPAISDDGLVIIGGYDQKVYALSTSSNRPETVWVFEGASDRIIGAPATNAEVVLVPSADHKLYALGLSNGQPIWDQPFESRHALWSAPLIDGDTVYLASLDHSLYALDLKSGAVLWENDLGSAISDTPSLSNGLLLSGTFEGILFALDKESGREVWQFDSGSAIWGNPVVEDDVVYVANVGKEAFALDLDNGAQIWQQTLASSASTSPITRDELVYFVSEEGAVEAFQKNGGDPAWPSNASILGRLLADPILVNDELFVPVMDNTECVVFGINAETGSARCVIQLDES